MVSDMLKGEIDILFVASNKLTQAATPAEQLDAVSDYARQRGANAGVLFYFNEQTEQRNPAVVAKWQTGDGREITVGSHLQVDPLSSRFARLWLGMPGQPIMVEDSLADERLDEHSLPVFKRYNFRAAVMLPLNSKGRWIGMLMFGWESPFRFDERDERIYTALIQQAAPVIDSVRLYEQIRERAIRAEFLLKINKALSIAADEVDILKALAWYPESYGAGELLLIYLNGSDWRQTRNWQPVAIWRDGVASEYEAKPLPVPPDHEIDQQILTEAQRDPSSVVFVENIETDERLTAASRADWIRTHKTRAVAALYLQSGGRYEGNLWIGWMEPHVFTEEEKYIYNQLLQIMPAVVASRRAYLAELEARYEREVLYQASQAINAANTFKEILSAVNRMNFGSGDFYLNIFENYDYDSARYFDIVATASDTFRQLGERWWLKDYPMVKKYPRQGVYVNEDIVNNPEIDDSSKAQFLRYGVLSNMRVSLSLNGRWMGALGIDDSSPRKFTLQEKRLMMGLGDLVAAAVERIRLQAESEASRQQAERLARVNAALSQAHNEWDIISAIGEYLNPLGGRTHVLHYIDLDKAGYVDTFRVVAVWQDHEPLLDHRFLELVVRRAEAPSINLWMHTVEHVTHLPDIRQDTLIDEGLRTFLNDVGAEALAIIPLYSNGRWQGIVTVDWDKPRELTNAERMMCEALIQTAGAVVATRRTYLAEQEAREENEFLYRLSETINAANSFEDIIHAVAQIDTGSEAVFLSAWENYDFASATYIEVKAVLSGNPVIPVKAGLRLPHNIIPLTEVMPTINIWVSEDTMNDPVVDERTRRFCHSTHIGAIITMQLNIHNRWLGMFTFMNTHPRKYTPRERRLAMGIGDLIAAAVERIRLQAETEISRQRAELLARINGELPQATTENDILTVVAKMAESSDVSLSIMAYIMSTEGNPLDRVNIVALRSGDGKSPLPLSFLPITSFRVADYPLLSLAGPTPNEPIFFENIFTDPRTEKGTAREFSRTVEWGAAILIPLRTGDRWQGVVSLVWKDPHPFSPEFRELFTAIQPILASVVARRRAYLDEQQRAYQLETVAKVSAAATSKLNERELLETISELTRISFRQYHFAIYLLDESQQYLVQETGFNPENHTPLDKNSRIRVPLTAERSLIAQAARTRQGAIVNDIHNAPQFTLLPMISKAGSEMAVPMVVANRLIGVVDIQAREVNRFNESDIWVMATMADLVAVAIQNARLYRQARDLAVFEERNRLARELHDSVSQALYGIALGTRTARTLLERDPSRLAEPLDYIASLAEAGLTEMRALIFDLRPNSLEEEGLISALTKQTASLQARHGIIFKNTFCKEPALPVETKEALYWIAREALHNTMKHAQASEVQMRVDCLSDTIVLEIIDNGQGFDTNRPFPGHLGLRSMQERAEQLYGTMELQSAPGKGTRIMVTVPVPQVLS